MTNDLTLNHGKSLQMYFCVKRLEKTDFQKDVNRRAVASSQKKVLECGRESSLHCVCTRSDSSGTANLPMIQGYGHITKLWSDYKAVVLLVGSRSSILRTLSFL